MPRVFAALSGRQVEVLRWIADGCPDAVMEGHSHKTTAVALQNRRLVVVSKKGGVWRAVLTEAGAYYLGHGTYQPSPTRPKAPARRAGPPRSPLPRRQQPTSPPGPPQTQPRALPPTEQLIADLLAHGEIKVSGPDRAKCEARVAAALRFGKVPPGKQLVTDGSRWSHEYVIRLRDAPAWLTATLEPIPVPASLRRPHPVVSALQSHKRPAGLDRSVAHRALLLTQALAVEADRRGHSVNEVKVAADAYGTRPEARGDFTVTVGRHSVGVEFRQEVTRVRHQPTAAEQAKVRMSTPFGPTVTI